MITREDMQSVLALASALDPRIPQASEATIAAWTESFSDYNFDLEDMLRAVNNHYREASERVMPNHVIKHAKRECAMRRRRRWREGIDACPDCDEEGWVLDPDDMLGWAVRCRHSSTQEIPVKPGHAPQTRPTTPEAIQASLDGYWKGVRTAAEERRASGVGRRGPRDYRRPPPRSGGGNQYDPDAWT